MLLIYPPVAKPCKPPGGIALLYGALIPHGVKCHILDANLEGLFFLLSCSKDLKTLANGRWTSLALNSFYHHLGLLRSKSGYENIDRYKWAVMDLNHLLGLAARQFGLQINLSDYQDASLSPLKSADLLLTAELHEENPFFKYVESRLPDLLEEDAADTVGISIQYLSQAICAFSLIGAIRRWFPRVRIVLDGGLVTSWMKRRSWHNPFIGLVDALVSGPGEDALFNMSGIKSADRPTRPDYIAPFPCKTTWPQERSCLTVHPAAATGASVHSARKRRKATPLTLSLQTRSSQI